MQILTIANLFLCFPTDDTPNLLAYYYGIIAVSFTVNVLLIGHTSYLLYKIGIAFSFFSKLKRNWAKPLQDRRSSGDSVFTSTFKTSNISSFFSSNFIIFGRSKTSSDSSLELKTAHSSTSSLQTSELTSSTCVLERSSVSDMVNGEDPSKHQSYSSSSTLYSQSQPTSKVKSSACNINNIPANLLKQHHSVNFVSL